MLAKFVRENKWVAVVLTVLRVYIGWEWLHHGWDKLKGGFDATGYLTNAVNNPVLDKATGEQIYPTYTAFIEHFALPNAKLFNFVIPLGEFLVGLGLILGGLTVVAALGGLLMNFMFLFAGTISTNPWFVLFGFIFVYAGYNTGRFGLDYYLLPLIRKGWKKVVKREAAA
ncbi:MAG: DoxX family protein [Candidatus Cohnella colombiensis]|uniref:DoxX family protein n=1 Tax=Candidatus Cohnella colombiensis TaxID=3121368 RepID=A0AA95EXZ3_9BACL|nr:MAG: DoxX family protein [Cohnella sp.]